MFTFQK